MPKKNHEFLIFGSIILGLFILLGVTNVDFTSFEVFATEHPEEEEYEYPFTERYENHEMTMTSNKSGIVKMGLPTYILDNQDEWVADLFYDDSVGFELESGSLSYYFDKVSCSMSLFNLGRININASVPIIKGDMWVVKVAPNGTDNWTDVSQNDLPCTVSYTAQGDIIELNSTKSDINGTISEIYQYEKYRGLKHTVYFTNNDTSLNNHKFSFSNILLDVPKSFTTYVATSQPPANYTSSFDYYSLWESELQPYQFGGNATIMDYNATEAVTYNGTQYSWNATQVYHGFNMIDKMGKTIVYDFGDGLDELWAVTFQSQPDHTLDIYIDYTNINEILAVNGTIFLDPIINFDGASGFSVRRPFAQNSGQCAGTLGRGADTIFQQQNRGFGQFGASKLCKMPMMFFDISAIPDDTTIVRTELALNVTSTQDQGFEEGKDDARVFSWLTENLLDVTDLLLSQFTIGAATNTILTPDGGQWFSMSGDIYRHCIVVTCPNVIVQSQTAELATANVQMQLQIESERDYLQIWFCQQPLVGLGRGCNFSTNQNKLQFANYDQPTTFLEVEFDTFTVPQAPQDVTVSFLLTPDRCRVDWEPVLDNGGRIVNTYEVQRDSGAGFITIATGLPLLPTRFDDTTIVPALSFKYKVQAVNDQGVGVASEETGGCGVPELPTAPLSVLAENAALNVVGLVWNLPFFDGNSEITGYRIERSAGAVSAPSDTWFWREHSSSATDSALQWLLDCVAGVAETGCEGTNRGVQIADRTDANAIATETFGSDSLFFSPPLNADFLNGLSLDVTWEALTNVGGNALNEILVFDGTYDRTSQIDFPDNATRALKGAGLLQTCFSVSSTGFSLITTNCVLDTSGSTEGEVTIFIQRINCDGCSGRLVITKVDITSYNLWDFDVAATTVVRELQATRSDFGIATAGINTFDPTAAQGFKTLSADTGNSIREFLDATVAVDTQYGYRVAAINSEGTSPFSNTAIITTVGLPPPPENVLATPTGTTTIQVQWTAAIVGDSTVEGYQIDRKLGIGGVFVTIQPFTGNDDTVFNDALLASGTEYCYRLKTFTNIGLSTTFSNEACATTQDQAEPPDNLIVTAIDGSQINVQWDTPPDDGGSEITGYKIERQKTTDPFQILFAERQPESNRILNDTGREVGTTYTYRISAITGFGQGETAQASDTTDATPQAPQNFACSPASSTAINLSWTTPLTFSAPTGYQIDRKLVGGSFSTIVGDTFSTATTFQDSGLAVDSIFVYRVLGHTAEGDTDFTPEITCSTLTAPDFPPENTRGDFSEVIPHQTVLAWDIPNTFGIPITEFRIERDDGAGYSAIGSVSGSSIAFIDQALDNDITQKYQIITVGTEGESVPSIAVPFDANQTSHWHYENTLDDTGFNKNTGTVFGVVNFNGTGHVGKGMIFDGTRLEVDPSQESDYDFDRLTSFGITSYFKGQPPLVPAFDDEWELREQQMIGLGSVAGSFTNTPPLSVDLITSRAIIHAFKVFEKSDIIGKTLNVTWAGSFTGVGLDNRIQVLDGFHDSTNSTDFPPDDGNGFGNPDKGAGLLHGINRFATFGTTTDSIVMTLAGSTESQITIAITNRIGAGGTSAFIDITKIEIVGVDSWTWDSSASVTMTVTGTNGDFGVTNANFTGITLISPQQIIVSKAQTLTDTGYKFYIDSVGKPSVKLTNTDGSNEIFVQATNVTDNLLHFIGFGYNGNGTASGISMNIDGTPVTPTIITDTLTGSILNNNPLTIGGTSTGTNLLLNATLDETRIFGSGSLDEDQLDEVAEDELATTASINGTMTISGSTFANISGELVVINITSGFPTPLVGTITLDNFTATQVNAVVPVGTIDPITGLFVFDRFFNIMGSLSNYTADTTLTNVLEAFPLLSNFDLQSPVFTFTGDFFFQQARNPTFDLLSFNFTQTAIPFDLTCNLKSTLFGNGTTFEFTGVFFIQELFPVDPFLDVVVACIDPSTPPIDLTAPSFGGSNALLSFVSFGDTTGIGNFLNFTENFGDFFGAGLPFLFIIILAAAFTGRSAPTGIIIIGVALGIMWFLGIIEQDPIMWGIIVVLIVLGALAGKKFL